MVTACHAQKEWIFRVHSAVIMRCIPKEKNREEEITCSVLHFEKHIEIRKELKNAAAELEDVKYKVMKTGIQLLKLW